MASSISFVRRLTAYLRRALKMSSKMAAAIIPAVQINHVWVGTELGSGVKFPSGSVVFWSNSAIANVDAKRRQAVMDKITEDACFL